jgi:hypothetical protein
VTTVRRSSARAIPLTTSQTPKTITWVTNADSTMRTVGATPVHPNHRGTSEATVKTHVNRILTWLALRDRVQVVVAAYESGLVVPGAG